MSISKRTAVAFAFVFAYAWPYCTKNFIFAQISTSISNNQLTLIAKKIWAIVTTHELNKTFLKLLPGCCQTGETGNHLLTTLPLIATFV